MTPVQCTHDRPYRDRDCAMAQQLDHSRCRASCSQLITDATVPRSKLITDAGHLPLTSKHRRSDYTNKCRSNGRVLIGRIWPLLLFKSQNNRIYRSFRENRHNFFRNNKELYHLAKNERVLHIVDIDKTDQPFFTTCFQRERYNRVKRQLVIIGPSLPMLDAVQFQKSHKTFYFLRYDL